MLLVILFLFGIIIKNLKEGFVDNNNNNNEWSLDTIKKFLKFQSTMHRNAVQYNLDVIQKQATPEEVEYLLSHGYWYWTDELKKLYTDAINKSTIVSVTSGNALKYGMQTYNPTAVTELLAWNTEEGNILLQQCGTNKEKELVTDCNPCIALDGDFSCPLYRKGKQLSRPWQLLRYK